MLSSCISAISEKLPNIRLVMVAKPYVCELYGHDKRISDFIPYTASWFPGYAGKHDGFTGFIRTIQKLRKFPCVAAINTVSDTRTNLLARLAGCKVLISAYGRHGHWLSTEVVATELDYQHEVERQMELASVLIGKKAEPYPLEIKLLPQDMQCAYYLLQEFDKNSLVVAVHPGANVDFKSWSSDSFIEIGKFLVKTKGCSVAVLGTPGSEEVVAKKLVEGIGSNAVNLAGKTPVRVLLALLKSSHLFIGNDSGPIHLAATAGCPTVAVFGATNPYRFGPYLPEDLKRVVVSPGFSLDVVGEAREKGRELLDAISVEMVIKAIDEIWEKAEAKHKFLKDKVSI